jgi:Zn-dependent peptidase ImmA (M78 family)
MNLLLEAIRRVLPTANIRAHDYRDVERIAKKERITIITASYHRDILGYYTTRRTRKQTKKFMMINSAIDTEAEKTFTGFHELGHHFLHAPLNWRQPLHCIRNVKVTQSKYDREADAFALIAMVPQWLLFELRDAGCSNITAELAPFLVKRQKLWELHGI